MKRLFFCALFFLTFTIIAQNKQDTSLYNKEVIRLGDSISKYIDFDKRKALGFTDEILMLTEQNKDTLMIISILHYLGRSNQFLKEYSSSTDYFERELSLMNSNAFFLAKDSLEKKGSFLRKVEVLAQLGQNYKENGDFNRALKTFNTCVEIAEKEDLEFYKVIMPTLIGDLYTSTGEYRKALAYNYKSFNGLKKAKTVSNLNKAYNRGEITVELSELYLKLNRVDSAIWILNEGIKEKLHEYNTPSKIIFNAQYGAVFLAKKKPEKALIYLKKAQNDADNYDALKGAIYYYEDLSTCYAKLKSYEKAITTLHKGIDARKRDIKEFYLANDYKKLAKYYKLAGNVEKSNEYFERYVLNQTALERSKKEVTKSFHSNELYELALEKQHQKKITLFLLLGGGLIIGVLALFAFNLVVKSKKETLRFKDLIANMEQIDKQQVPADLDTNEVVATANILGITAETKQQILEGLEKLKSQKYYLKQECSLHNYAKKIKTNTSYLSKVVNASFEKNFNTYINDLRINYVLLTLKVDTRFRAYSIKSIAEELGYKSADSFSKYFKIRTGLLPSVYIKKLNKLG